MERVGDVTVLLCWLMRELVRWRLLILTLVHGLVLRVLLVLVFLVGFEAFLGGEEESAVFDTGRDDAHC